MDYYIYFGFKFDFFRNQFVYENSHGRKINMKLQPKQFLFLKNT